MYCRVCSGESNEIFSAKILKKLDIKYYLCPTCNFLQTENPYWLDEAYKSAIGTTDTGLLKRNQLFSKRTAAVINLFFNKEKKFLDYAGGYGIFVRMMRDLGYDFYWVDPYTPNLLARGFEYHNSDTIELLTAFECFEHFVKPIIDIEKMISISENIIFSTRLFGKTPPQPKEWWYYSFESGQHISLYSITTLKFLAKKFNLHLCSDNKAFHMLSKKKASNFLFNMVLKLSDSGLNNFIGTRLKSKTELDHEFLSDKREID